MLHEVCGYAPEQYVLRVIRYGEMLINLSDEVLASPRPSLFLYEFTCGMTYRVLRATHAAVLLHTCNDINQWVDPC